MKKFVEIFVIGMGIVLVLNIMFWAYMTFSFVIAIGENRGLGDTFPACLSFLKTHPAIGFISAAIAVATLIYMGWQKEINRVFSRNETINI